MLIIPAIDIIQGNCVRLTQGDFGRLKVYSKDPLEVARSFAFAGAKFLHVIDLDGAKSGKPENFDLIIELCKKNNVPVQVGGGIRTLKTIMDYLNAGIERVILGTKAFEDSGFLKEALSEFGADKIVVALDVRDGKLMVEGWLRGVDEDLEYALLRLKVLGVKYLLVTDITRDGTLKRPNFNLIKNVSDFGFEVIAAGGISSEDDLRILKESAQAVVLGKSLYEGRLSLEKILATPKVGKAKNSYLTKRLIPCLDVKNGRVVKGINFLNLKDAGDPVELAKIYAADGADELVFLDISASIEGRKTMCEIVEKVAKEIFIPFTVGGGVRDLSDIRDLLNAGADKVAINSSAVLKPQIISEAAKQFGSQCVVVAMDVKKVGEKWKIFIKGGSVETDFEVIEWAKMVEKLGAGEILLTSMDRDGTKDGFDLELIRFVSEIVKIPVIASGGAGSLDDFKMAFEKGKADAVLAASLFHSGEISVKKLKSFMNLSNISIRL